MSAPSGRSMILIVHRAHTTSPMLGLARGLEAGGASVAEELVENVAAMRELRAVVAKHKPTAVILAESFDDRRACEVDPDRAFRENAEAAISLAAATLEFAARPVLISTSEVFGQGRGPWSEADAPEPETVYANSMLRAEQFLGRASRAALIVRVGAVYADGLAGERARLSGGEGPSPAEVVSLVTAFELGRAIGALLAADTSGVVHVAAGGDPPSRAEVDRKIASLLGIDPPKLGPSKRGGCGLYTDRLRKVLELPSWEAALDAQQPPPEPMTPVVTSPPAKVEGALVFAEDPRFEGRLWSLAPGERSLERTAARSTLLFVVAGKALVELKSSDEDIVLKRHGKLSIAAQARYVLVAVEATELIELG